ncbi:MAG: transcriptional regulator [Candidatus Eisenbacteria bacterium]
MVADAVRKKANARREPSHAPSSGRATSSHHDLDRIIHERVRLAIVSALAVTPRMSFNELKAQLRITDGNLSVHARRLEEAGYLDCHKSFEGRVPRTEFHLTAAGRRALQRYLDHMEALIRVTREG